MKYILISTLALSLSLATFSAKSDSTEGPSVFKSIEEHSINSTGFSEMSGSIRLELYRYQTSNNTERIFYELSEEEGEWVKGLYAADDNQKPRKVRLYYDRYHDGQNFLEHGWGEPLYYKVSKDGRDLFVVSQMHANSDGWVTEYQLFKIDCETLDSYFLADCAAIEATDNGFTIAVARLTNSDEAKGTCDEIWLMHDQMLDRNGTLVNFSSEEYDYTEMWDRFACDAEGCHLVKGFKRHFITYFKRSDR